MLFSFYFGFVQNIINKFPELTHAEPTTIMNPTSKKTNLVSRRYNFPIITPMDYMDITLMKNHKKAGFRDFDLILSSLVKNGSQSISEIAHNLDLEDTWSSGVNRSLKDGVLRDLGLFCTSSIHKKNYNKKLSLNFYGVMFAMYRYRDLSDDAYGVNTDGSGYTGRNYPLLDALAATYSKLFPLIFGKWDYLIQNKYINVHDLFSIVDPEYIVSYNLFDVDHIFTNLPGHLYFGDCAIFQAAFYLKIMDWYKIPKPMLKDIITDKEIFNFCEFTVKKYINLKKFNMHGLESLRYSLLDDVSNYCSSVTNSLNENWLIKYNLKSSDDCYLKLKSLGMSDLKKISVCVNSSNNSYKLSHKFNEMEKSDILKSVETFDMKTINVENNANVKQIMRMNNKHDIVDSIFDINNISLRKMMNDLDNNIISFP